MFRALYQCWLRQRRPLFRIVRRRWPGYRSLPLRLEMLEPRILLDGSNECFLEAVYRDLLHRPLDNQSLAGWGPLLQQGVSRQAVVSQIENSTEYRTDVIDQLYSSYLHHPADPAGVNACLGYLQGGGMIEGLEIALLGSPEFFQAQAGGTAAGFLEALYEDVLGRPVDPVSEMVLGSMIESGVPTAEVAFWVVTSPEADIHFVENCYQTDLGHPADLFGLIEYTSLLLLGAGQENVLASIVGSPEYFALNQCGSEEETPSPLAPPPVQAPPPVPAPPPVSAPPPAPTPSPACGFDPGLTGWTVAQTGGSATRRGTVTVQNTDAVLREGDSLTTSLQKTFTIPNTPSVLQFSYDDLSFDTTSHSQIKDAFEAAFVDSTGNSLVQTIGSNKDSFFNITEGQSPALVAGVAEAKTDEGQTVSLNLAGLTAGTTGTLVLRFVNNDSDTNTSIHITCVEVNAVPGETPAVATPAVTPRTPQQSIDFASVSDVSPSAAADYGQTSFRNDETVLYSNLSIKNIGTYAMRAPLLVGITHLSDPTIHVQNADGTLPDGTPYFDLSSQAAGGLLQRGQETGSREVAFFDPQRTPFTYDLKVLAQLNRPPAFTSQPNTEGIPGVPFAYKATATDPDGDKLSFSLLAGPAGMTVDANTGEMTWSPQQADLGNHVVTLEVDDGLGGSAEQSYTLGVIPAPPNRPPVFTSTPVVDANINTPYIYQATAGDPDGEALTFSVVSGPPGLKIDPQGGQVTWTPTADQLGTSSVTLQVDDGQGGTATQTYSVAVAPEAGDFSPVIISTPPTQFPVVTPGTPTGVVTPNLLTLATGEQQTDHVTVQVPLASPPPAIDLQPTSIDISGVTTDPQTLALGGTAHVTVRNNGPDTYQSSALGVFDTVVFEDRNDNGTFDLGVDNVLGSATFAGTLASGGSTTLDVPLSGILQFRDKPLHVMVDSDNRIPETDETNNTLDTGLDSQHQPTGNWLPMVKWQQSLAPDTLEAAPAIAPLIDTNGDGKIDARDVPAIIINTGVGGARVAGHLEAIRGDTGAVIFDVPLPADADPLAVPTVGDIDGDGRPEIILGSDGEGFNLYAFNNDGTVKWKGQQPPDSVTSALPVLADLDGNGKSEILYGDSVLNSDGTVRWDALRVSPHSAFYHGGGSYWFAMQPADLNLDGIPEIVAGPSVLDRNGHALWSWREVPDVVTRDYVAQLSVNDGPWVDQFHTNVPLSDGWTAVVHRDGDPFPEIMVVSPQINQFAPYQAAGLWIFKHDGSLSAPPVGLLQSNAFNGVGPEELIGPPTVADFDGDGQPEIALNVVKSPPTTTFLDPERSILYVFRMDGTEVWHKDLTPANVGPYTPPPVAFDFDGDGVPELVTQDAQYLYILDGRTGATRFQIAIDNNGDGTLNFGQNPLIADVDNDGHAEIVAEAMLSFVTGAPPRQGLVVLGDANGNWEHARRSWNEWMYQPAFVNEDGSVPLQLGNPLEVQNGLRTQVPIQGVDLAAAPDLSVSQVTVDPTNSPASLKITARIGNGGSLQAGAGVAVDFYLGDPDAGGTLLGAETTTQPLFPGDFEDVSFTWNNPTAGQIVVTVNEAPPSPLTPSSDLALLPNTWAEASGFKQFSAVSVNGTAYFGIDGNPGTAWIPPDPSLNIDPRQPFYEVHFPFPVAISSITIQNGSSTNAFLGTGTLDFSNGFSTPIPLDSTGSGETTFPEQDGITWVRLTSSATGTNGAGLAEFIPGGSYVQPQFLVPEGDGRLGNNRASLVLTNPSALADPPPVVKAGPDQTIFDGDTVSLNPATFTDPVLLETHTATIDWGDQTVESGTVQEADGSGTISDSHKYAATGTYTVTVTVRDAAGNTDSDHLTVTVLPASFRQPPIDVVPSDPNVSLVNLTGPLTGIGPGQTAAFDVRLTGPDAPEAFNLLFERPATGVLLGSIPVVVNSTYTYQVKAVDGDGDSLTFSLPTAPAGASIDPSSGLIRWTPSQPGTYDFEVEVSDGHGGTATQSYQLTVAAGQPNQNPVISSTPPTRAIVFRDFSYQVTASDPDGDPVSYFLTQAPAGMTIDSATGNITWRPDRSQVGSTTVTVSVRDPRGGQASQTFNLDVTLDLTDKPPVITSTPPTVAIPGHLLSYQVTATDAENDPLRFDLPLRPAGMAIDPTTGLLTWDPAAAQVGVQNVIVRVRDINDGVSLQQFQITVERNSAPIITSGLPPGPAVVGEPFRYAPLAQDAGNVPLTFTLDAAPAGMTINPSTGIITWTPRAGDVGSQHVALTATDGLGGEAHQEFDLPVVASAPNEMPVITSTPRQTIRIGGNYRYAVQATDADGDPLTYHLDTAPAGMNIDAAGLISWQPTGDESGANPVVLHVDDGRGGSVSQSFTINVVTQLTDQPPVIETTPPLAATVGRPYVYDAQAADPDHDPLVWSFDKAPPGMSVNPLNGTVRWTPTADEVGLQTAVLRVTDAQGESVAQTIPVIVRSVNVPPVITSTPPTEAAVSTAYTYQVQATDAEHDPLKFSLTAAPAGMNINAVSGLIQWTPSAAEAGPQTVTVQADDGQGGIAVQTYTVVVSLTPPDQPPVITSIPLLRAIASTPYQYQVTVSEPENQAVQFALTDAPTGMTIDPTSGLVQWTPGPSQAGQAGALNLDVVTITATDTAGKVATQRYTLGVRAVNHPPVINSQPVTSVLPGALYSYDVQASDPDADPLSYHLDTAPAGMTVDAQGRIRWSPTAADLGDHSVILSVSDGLGGTVSQPFTVTVGPDTEAPRVNVQVNPNQVDIGAPATVVVSATDNVGVQTLGLTVNGVPVALDTMGRGSVMMNQAGLFAVVATATDAAGNIGKATSQLTVINPNVTGAPTVALTSPADGAVITSPSDVIGTASDPNLLSYELDIAPVGSDNFTPVFQGKTSVTNGTLGKFDPTMLQNDSYVLRLTAENAGGISASTEETISVTGNLKLGNFTLAFTDLTVPVSGIPITLTRTYDTMQAGTSEDFGYGWRLNYRDTRLRTSVPKTGDEANGIHNPFRDGTRVYVTLPGGQREGFTFKPVSQFIGGAFYQPNFVSDPGVTDTLTVPGEVSNGSELGAFQNLAGQNGAINIFQQTDGTYTNDAGIPYNPADDLFGGVYFVTTKDGTQYQIDALSGQMQTVTDRNGNTLTFTDAGISSSAGPAITFGRDAQGHIVSVTDPMGQSIHYQYDAKGDLAAVTDRMNNTTQFVYRTDRPHYLDHAIDPLGRTGTRTDYDSQGRMIGLTSSAGTTIKLNNDPGTSTETIVDALGNPTTYLSDDRGNILVQIDALGNVTRQTYNTNNNLLSETDPLGDTTSFTYDGSGNVLTKTDPLGNTTRFTYDAFNQIATTTDPLGNTTTNTYDARGNLVSSSDPAGIVTKYTHDAAGHEISFTDGAGNISRSQYDDMGNVVVDVDPLGNETDYTYDGNGNQLSQTTTVTDPTGPHKVTTTTTYDRDGLPTSVTDGNGNTTQTQYDSVGRRKATIDALGRQTQYRYDDQGRLVETLYADGTSASSTYDAAGMRVTTTDQAGRTTRYEYDALGRMVLTIYPDNTQSEVDYDAAGRVTATVDELGRRTEFGYDAAGRQTLVRDALGNTTTTVYDAAGHRIRTIDPLGHATAFVYDSLGHTVRTLFADGSSTSTTYDAMGRSVSATDQAGVTTHYEYDPNGRLTAVIDALAGRTTYAYDERGDLVRQVDANGHVTTFEYDNVGRQIAEVLPLGQRSMVSYDAAGNVASTTDFNGNTIRDSYDSNNRLVTEAFPDGTSIRYSYTVTGQLDTVIDARGTTTYTYDARDRLLSRIDPDGTTISYTYDAAGNETSVTIPVGKTVYTFDADNRLATVTDPEKGVTTYTYDAASDLIKTELPNGTSETRQYDALNRLVYLENDGPRGVISSYRYTLAPAGNRLEVDEDTGRRVIYTYDALYRLIGEAITDSANGDRTINYTYDQVGNRLTRSDSAEGLTGYTYDANDRLLMETQGNASTAYTYDDDGNTLSQIQSPMNRAFYRWDFQNRLIGATITDATGTHEIQNAYDANGIRVSQTVDGNETRYLVDGNRPFPAVLEEYRPSGAVNVSYVYGVNLISQQRADVKRFYHVDGLGSTRALSDGLGNVTDRYVYDAFGRTISQTGTTVNVYLFAGQERDYSLGLDYLRARYLNTETGRFTAADSFEGSRSYPQTLNRYVYAGADPVDHVDPSGHDDLTELMIAIGTMSVLYRLAAVGVGSYLAGGRLPDAVAFGIGFDKPVVSNFQAGVSVTFGAQVEFYPRERKALVEIFGGADFAGGTEPDPEWFSPKAWGYEGWFWNVNISTPLSGFLFGGLAVKGFFGAIEVADKAIGVVTGITAGKEAELFVLGGKPIKEFGPYGPLSKSALVGAVAGSEVLFTTLLGLHNKAESLFGGFGRIWDIVLSAGLAGLWADYTYGKE